MARAAIIGVTGRMGAALVRAAADFPGLTIGAAVASAGSPALGRDAGEISGTHPLNVPVTADLAAALAVADVAIDFSSASATAANLAACRQAGKALLIGTTGFPATLSAQFDQAAGQIALLVAPNTSIGVTLLTELVRQAARALPPGFDIEIVESHHRGKQDAPSGTALALGRAAAEARGLALAEPVGVRQGGGGRQGTEIGFAVVRGGDLVGTHTVLFAGTGESLELTHRATDRAVFARGALQTALWLVDRPAGRYFMRDLVTYKSGS